MPSGQDICGVSPATVRPVRMPNPSTARLLYRGEEERYVEALIGEPGWLDALGVDRPVDAAVSTTALHYLTKSTLRGVYQDIAKCLRPGGVFVNGDHMSPDSATIRGLALDVGRRHAERHLTSAHEDWQS
ncbi:MULTISPECIES: class I SAM-dependent methyltransferase [unclassified Streptomyces]|uniref:class I SAM-dependent methyltransferase n=1 Tax=unclassified Streptomyces TaxID=2593676 RepID=UPI003863FFA5